MAVRRLLSRDTFPAQFSKASIAVQFSSMGGRSLLDFLLQDGHAHIAMCCHIIAWSHRPCRSTAQEASQRLGWGSSPRAWPLASGRLNRGVQVAPIWPVDLTPFAAPPSGHCDFVYYLSGRVAREGDSGGCAPAAFPPPQLGLPSERLHIIWPTESEVSAWKHLRLCCKACCCTGSRLQPLLPCRCETRSRAGVPAAAFPGMRRTSASRTCGATSAGTLPLLRYVGTACMSNTASTSGSSVSHLEASG